MDNRGLQQWHADYNENYKLIITRLFLGEGVVGICLNVKIIFLLIFVNMHRILFKKKFIKTAFDPAQEQTTYSCIK